MKNNLVVCGDSFNYGLGCADSLTQAYGVRVANHFGWDLIRLARGSASNYSIYLQGIYAADMEDTPALIILGQTSFDRVEWLVEGTPWHIEHSLTNLNYHQYPPHNNDEGRGLFHLNGDPTYNPFLLTEQIVGIDHCISLRKEKQHTDWYDRLATEPTEKLQLICNYYTTVFNYHVKRNYDISMLFRAYSYIKRKGIECIILTPDVEEYSKYMDSSDLCFQDWAELSKRFPEPSHHTTELGHADTADRIIQHLKNAKSL